METSVGLLEMLVKSVLLETDRVNVSPPIWSLMLILT